MVVFTVKWTLLSNGFYFTKITNNGHSGSIVGSKWSHYEDLSDEPSMDIVRQTPLSPPPKNLVFCNFRWHFLYFPKTLGPSSYYGKNEHYQLHSRNTSDTPWILLIKIYLNKIIHTFWSKWSYGDGTNRHPRHVIRISSRINILKIESQSLGQQIFLAILIIEKSGDELKIELSVDRKFASSFLVWKCCKTGNSCFLALKTIIL